jgi:hypothetical protein
MQSIHSLPEVMQEQTGGKTSMDKGPPQRVSRVVDLKASESLRRLPPRDQRDSASSLERAGDLAPNWPDSTERYVLRGERRQPAETPAPPMLRSTAASS